MYQYFDLSYFVFMLIYMRTSSSNENIIGAKVVEI